MLGLNKKITNIAMEIIDKTLGKKFPLIDRLTDLFQEQKVLENKVKDLQLEIEAIKSYLKDKNE